MPLPFESVGKKLAMPKRIPDETKQRAIGLVLDHLATFVDAVTVNFALRAICRVGPTIRSSVGR